MRVYVRWANHKVTHVEALVSAQMEKPERAETYFRAFQGAPAFPTWTKRRGSPNLMNYREGDKSLGRFRARISGEANNL